MCSGVIRLYHVMLLCVATIFSVSHSLRAEKCVLRYKIEAVAPETMRYVQNVLEQLGVEKPEDVFVTKTSMDTSKQFVFSGIPLEVDFEQKLSNPRCIYVYEPEFNKLSEAQKRFVIARTLLNLQPKADVGWREAEGFVSVFGAWATCQVAITAGLKYWGHHIWATDETPFCAGFILSFCAAGAVMAKLGRNDEHDLDAQAAIFSGDINEVIRLFEAKHKERPEDFFEENITIFNSSPPIRSRLHFLRKLALQERIRQEREQRSGAQPPA